MAFKSETQQFMAARLRALADAIERGELTLTHSLPSMSQAKGEQPVWSLELCWTDKKPAADQEEVAR